MADPGDARQELERALLHLKLMDTGEWEEPSWLSRSEAAALSAHIAALDDYRIEADKAIGEYDALEVDASLMAKALDRIARRRPNEVFDPWACAVAREALSYVSERTTATQSDEEFMAWARPAWLIR